ncbi:glycogen synthase [uncultured Shewanella sp.]|uniref:glycogen synthase n=1 Tax=uncultured Shewanella sp. TaxID=173975 RepID=UPI002619E862|nr:glycogen/starch synthase [uncultured Shewanella sp.]
MASFNHVEASASEYGARVLMLAAENGAIAGAKVGGMADVIRDLPLAMAGMGVAVDVAMPNFGNLINTADARWVGDVQLQFSGQEYQVGVYQAAHPALDNCNFYLFQHPLFNGSYGAYSQGDANRPFAEDATKFALFNLAVAEALRCDTHAVNNQGIAQKRIEQSSFFKALPNIVHLHDWHTAPFAVLRAFDPNYAFLQALPCVFSIHNLALQGIRPIRDEPSSFAAWYPELLAQLSEQQLNLFRDPRYPNCINPMRAGIVLSDKVHLVSPSYAEEVLLPSEAEKGFFGGEGLEQDLLNRLEEQALVGILNGCMYPDGSGESNHLSEPTSDLNRQQLINSHIELAQEKLIAWQVGNTQVRTQDFIAKHRLQQWQRSVSEQGQADGGHVDEAQTSPFIMTSVGRLTDQKVLILRARFPSDIALASLRGKTVLEALLDRLAKHQADARFVLLGSGDEVIAREFSDIAAKYPQFVFLNGYDEQLSQQLYQLGSLFLMPSSFEPCGISQMLAMREGQLCLVNRIGGLKDTVHHLETGFVFEGDDLLAQGLSLLAMFEQALSMVDSQAWLAMQQHARMQRFDWHSQAQRYKQRLYSLSD